MGDVLNLSRLVDAPFAPLFGRKPEGAEKDVRAINPRDPRWIGNVEKPLAYFDFRRRLNKHRRPHSPVHIRLAPFTRAAGEKANKLSLIKGLSAEISITSATAPLRPLASVKGTVLKRPRGSCPTHCDRAGFQQLPVADADKPGLRDCVNAAARIALRFIAAKLGNATPIKLAA